MSEPRCLSSASTAVRPAPNAKAQQSNSSPCFGIGAPRRLRGGFMKIYVASSWRNTLHPEIVTLLRSEGHDVYNFRHPTPDSMGFSWSEIDPEWQDWTPRQYREALEHPIAKRGFSFDMTALQECDACLLVLPSGRSAS